MTTKWFDARGKSLNWHKEDSQTVRRRNALNSRKGIYLNTARALQALANITKDSETKRKALGDAKYFFHRYHMIVKTNEEIIDMSTYIVYFRYVNVSGKVKSSHMKVSGVSSKKAAQSKAILTKKKYRILIAVDKVQQA